MCPTPKPLPVPRGSLRCPETLMPLAEFGEEEFPRAHDRIPARTGLLPQEFLRRPKPLILPTPDQGNSAGAKFICSRDLLTTPRPPPEGAAQRSTTASARCSSPTHGQDAIIADGAGSTASPRPPSPRFSDEIVIYMARWILNGTSSMFYRMKISARKLSVHAGQKL